MQARDAKGIAARKSANQSRLARDYQQLLTVGGDTAKAGQTRHIPLNAEALLVLKQRKEQSSDTKRVFANDTGLKSAWGKLLEAAEITVRFRWQNLWHHFASRLAQAGVPLNTIRELLGHRSMAMTLQYAHLAPDQKKDAVAKLVAVIADANQR